MTSFLTDQNADCTAKATPTFRRELTLADKVEFIKTYEASVGGISIRRLAQRFNIGKTSALSILKRKDEYLRQYASNFGGNRRRVRRHSKFHEINSCMWKWFKMARYKRINVTGTRLQEQALKFSNRLNIQDFKASNGWLDSFKKCYNIRSLCSKTSQAGLFNDFDWKSRLPSLIGEFNLEDVFCCKELALCYRALPSSSLWTLISKSDGEFVKVKGERLTLMLCCSAMGEKLTPWVMGSNGQHRQDVTEDPSTLCCVWRNSNDAMMTREIFVTFLESLNLQLQQKNRKILIFLNQSPVHGDLIDLSNITLKFLPVNTVSVLQPLDLGITRLFKGFYRKQLLSHLLTCAERGSNCELFAESVTLPDAMKWIHQAWETVGSDVIMKSFSDAGFPFTQYIPPPDYNEMVECELQALVNVVSGVNKVDPLSVEDFLTFDGVLETEKEHADDWEEQIAQEVLAERNVSPEEIVSVNIETDDDDYGCEEEKPPPPGSEMTHGEAVDLVIKLQNFALMKESCLLPLVNNLRDVMESLISEKSKQKKS